MQTRDGFDIEHIKITHTRTATFCAVYTDEGAEGRVYETSFPYGVDLYEGEE